MAGNLFMRVLLVTEFFPDKNQAMSGGVETRVFYVAKYLKNMGHQVEIIARKKSQVAATPLSIFSRLWFQFEAVVKALKVKAEVVEGSNFVSYLPAYMAARLTGAKAMAWYADVYYKTWFKTMSWPVAITGYAMEWLSLRLKWDRVIAMSEQTKRKLVQAGISNKKIEVVYGGVDLEAINAIRTKKFSKPTVCTAARLVNYKHIDDLIKAIGMAQKKRPQLHLMIMGDGPERKRLEELSTNFTIQNSVRFVGNQPQEVVWKVMKQSHVFCLPSTVEGFGLATVEAMACGLPFINTDIPINREVTHDGKGGLFFKPGDIKALANGVLQLLTLTHHRKKVDEGKRLVRKYDWTQITQNTFNVYTQ